MSFGIRVSNPMIKLTTGNDTKTPTDKKNLKLVREEIVDKKVKDPKTGKMKKVKVRRKVYQQVDGSAKDNGNGFGVRTNANARADYY